MSNQKIPNRLANEKSPYLLQHQYNPVDWYPWGEEAFEKAKEEDKPVFLSIGYSTCHWCHVMERESFEDEEVAEVLNKYYISIKVDREERTDVDAIYMAVCQALTGQGGWPLTIFMTPDKKPFFAGTYFPKERKYGRSGIIEILEELQDAWENKRDKVLSAGESVVKGIENKYFKSEAGAVEREALDHAYRYYEQSFDSIYGGFGEAPKFPTPHNLTFLLRYWKMSGNKKALDMVEKTLQSMYQGGMYDHVGWGFSRYSTDKKWLVPHFEKMLYDNALLAIAYLECYQATQNEFYARVAREIFSYVLRDMTSEEGGFFSAEDADSEGVEGKFYVWSLDEVFDVLGRESGKAFCQTFDISNAGNFEGENIPNIIGKDLNTGQDLKNEREKLFLHREKRIHPLKDDKILTAWNGLMIAALATGARVLGDKKYAKAAENAAEFVNTKLRREDGRLFARYRDGETAHLAYVDDYAFFIWGLIELYQTSYNPKYLALSLEFHQDMVDLFWDEKEGGLYLYGHDGEKLITKPKELYDGAVPSGNSVAALNFLRLADLTGDEKIAELADKQLNAFGGTVSQSPPGYAYFLMAVYFAENPTTEINIIGDLNKKETSDMLDIINKGFNPERLVAVKMPGSSGEEICRLIPIIKERDTVDGKTTAYICENFSCQPPTTDIKKLEILLGKKS
ncbi:MAG: thioredoxin [Desulfitibacter sp. BRH_c19]|nr:MAG: thioredoxin [Desulfitibacter sp. BRH_c19]